MWGKVTLRRGVGHLTARAVAIVMTVALGACGASHAIAKGGTSSSSTTTGTTPDPRYDKIRSVIGGLPLDDDVVVEAGQTVCHAIRSKANEAPLRSRTETLDALADGLYGEVPTVLAGPDALGAVADVFCPALLAALPLKSPPSTTSTTAALATLQQQVNAEVARACHQVVSDQTAAADAVQYDDNWSRVLDKQALIGAVEGCVLQQQADDAASATPVNVDAIVRNPDAVADQVFVMVVNISQFDTATGNCSFRAYWDGSDHTYSFDFAGDNAVFTAGFGNDCPALNGIDQDDVVRVWAKSTGSDSYTTTLGGTLTVPSFYILKTQLIRKA